MKPHIRSLTCVVLLAAQLLTGCTSWQVVEVSPRALVDSAHVTRMQVTERGGAKYIIDTPRLVGDSLTGSAFREDYVNRVTMQSGQRVVAARHVPLAAINQVAVRKPSSGATAGLVVGIVAVVVVVGAAAASSELKKGDWLCAAICSAFGPY